MAEDWELLTAEAADAERLQAFVGLGRIAALYFRSSTSYREIRYLYF
jgi:hypothetical protein